MLPKDEFLYTYQKRLEKLIEQQAEYILSGPTVEQSDEISLEYKKRLGELEGAKKALTLFEDTVTAYYGK